MKQLFHCQLFVANIVRSFLIENLVCHEPLIIHHQYDIILIRTSRHCQSQTYHCHLHIEYILYEREYSLGVAKEPDSSNGGG